AVAKGLQRQPRLAFSVDRDCRRGCPVSLQARRHPGVDDLCACRFGSASTAL
ncbi:Chromate transport protein ChrA, partial [Pseudomonas sp. FG-3G]